MRSEPSRAARLNVSGWGGGGREGTAPAPAPAPAIAAADTSVWSMEEVRRGGGGGFGRPATQTEVQGESLGRRENTAIIKQTTTSTTDR